MILRIAIALGIAAALIPVSLLLGLSAARSIVVSIMMGLLFFGLSGMMAMLFKK